MGVSGRGSILRAAFISGGLVKSPGMGISTVCLPGTANLFWGSVLTILLPISASVLLEIGGDISRLKYASGFASRLTIVFPLAGSGDFCRGTIIRPAVSFVSAGPDIFWRGLVSRSTGFFVPVGLDDSCSGILLSVSEA
jgi:hypothetical protein